MENIDKFIIGLIIMSAIALQFYINETQAGSAFCSKYNATFNPIHSESSSSCDFLEPVACKNIVIMGATLKSPACLLNIQKVDKSCLVINNTLGECVNAT